MMNKHEVVLSRITGDEKHDIQFAEQEDPELGTGVFLLNQTWRDMGKPDSIKVTVVPNA